MRRAVYLQDIPDIDVSSETTRLAAELIRVLQLPQKAEADASHVALCILHRMDYLLTWNCTHLANPVLQKELIDYCTYHKLHVPVICTPEYLTLQSHD